MRKVKVFRIGLAGFAVSLSLLAACTSSDTAQQVPEPIFNTQPPANPQSPDPASSATNTPPGGTTAEDTAPGSNSESPETAGTSEPESETETKTGPALAKNCGDLLSTIDLTNVFQEILPGETTFKYANDFPSGRTGQVVCRYGVKEDGQAVVEVTMNGYVDELTAQSRVSITENSAKEKGASFTEHAVPAGQGFLAVDMERTTLNIFDADRTFVISIRNDALPEAQRVAALDTWAKVILERQPATTAN